MSNLAQRIQWAIRIRDHASGWESDWDVMAGELIDPMKRRVRHMFRGRPNAGDDLDDFVAGKLSEYHEKAKSNDPKKRLFASWNPSRRDPVKHLSGRLLILRAIDYLVEQGTFPTPYSGVTGNDQGHTSIIDSVSSRIHLFTNPARYSSVHDTLNRNIRLKLGTGGLSQPMIHAGIQFYPRLDNSMARRRDLESAIPKKFKDKVGWEIRLDETHNLRRVALRGEIAKISSRKLSANGEPRDLTPKTRNDIDGQILLLYRDLYLMPLDAEALMRLLDLAPENTDNMAPEEIYRVTRNKADAARSTHLRELPKLLVIPDEIKPDSWE